MGATPSPAFAEDAVLNATDVAASSEAAANTAVLPASATSPTSPEAPNSRELFARLGVRLQIDGFAFKRYTDKSPRDSLLIKRARLEASGGMGDVVGFYLAGDFAAAVAQPSNGLVPSFLATTDDYIYVRPFGDRLILQIGQFDAPLTYENRTSDKYIDFMERSLTVRAMAIPSNKELGLMLSGLSDNQITYYELGIFNGDGPNMRDIDSSIDVIGRVQIAPLLSTSIAAFHNATVGTSMRAGRRDARYGMGLAAQTTQGGFIFMPFKADGTALYEGGALTVYAAELNLPFNHRLGLRAEYVYKNQGVSQAPSSNPEPGVLSAINPGRLEGSSYYIEAWWWVLGEDSLLDAGGRELPRVPQLQPSPSQPVHGLMIALRGEHLRESVTFSDPSVADPTIGQTGVASVEVGVNYWYAKNFRCSFDYVVNVLSGTSNAIASAIAANGGHTAEQEWLARVAVAL